MNKRKMKTKTKSKSRSRKRGGGTRKIFKKSHKRYANKSMKRHIQRGGNKDRKYRLLMESYKDPKSEESKTAMEMLFGNIDEDSYKKFKKLLEERDKLQPNLWLIVTGIRDIFDTDTAFDIEKSSSSGFAQGNWIELVKYMRSIVSSRVSADIAYAQDLQWRLDQLGDSSKPAHLQTGRDIKELAANLQVSKMVDKIQHSRGKMSREVNVVDTKSQFGQPRTTIKAPISESRNLDTSKFVEPLKTYLTYRLSAGRQGSNDIRDKIGAIGIFNEKIRSIDTELVQYSDRPSGEKLYNLLESKGLIPVYFGKGDSRNDSVPDDKCEKSVRDGLFKTSIFSSGKHHCRTCGRCMNKADKTTYGDPDNMFLNPVCIDCRDLFSGVLHPGGAAA